MIIGTRGSPLALAQARQVGDRVPDAELRVVRTAGDASTAPLEGLGDGVFVTAIERELREGRIDAAVHSLKDLPTGARDGLVVAALLPRADARDVLVTTTRGGLASLPRGARVGTSSPRRDAFLRAARPDIRVDPIRGNVETRLAKVARGEFDATVLALAGLRRLGIAVADAEILAVELMPPAPGQGAIAVQCREDDAATRERLSLLDDRVTRRATDCEREILRLLGASCALALGAFAVANASTIDVVACFDGRVCRRSGADPLTLAAEIARDLSPVIA